MAPEQRHPPPQDKPRLHHAVAACMAMALFFFLLWFGMTIVHDSARNSALIAFVLSLLLVVSLYLRPRASR
jgi:hypothetical protein